MRVLPALLLRLSLLVALAASAVLVVEYQNAGDPAFCGVQSGCFAVRVSPYSNLLGALSLPQIFDKPIPLPSAGLAAFAGLLGMSMLVRKKSHHLAVAVLAGLGALFALRLLYLQKYDIQAFCPWCVVVDVCAIVAAVAAAVVAWMARTRGEASVALPAKGNVMFAWSGAALLGVVAPYIWAQFPVQPPLPAPVQALQVPGKLTLVGFTDFECPHCRSLHPVVHEELAKYPDRLHLIRKMAPLTQIHPGAEAAALAFLCAPDEQKEAVATKLYEADPAVLRKEGGAIGAAASAGADREALARCVKAPETRARLEADLQLYEELGGRGLPFTFVGRSVVRGANAERFRDVVAKELGGSRPSLPLWAMFVLLGAAFAGAAGVTVVTARREAEEAERSASAG